MSKNNAKLWDECQDDEKKQLMQLFDDMIPYYRRIAVYDVDKEFVAAHKEQCLRLALAARRVTLQTTDVTPEQVIFSDELFGRIVTKAWQDAFSDVDRLFFNAHLQQAAEAFRMGIMMADLPQF